jgi:hypothetical protein
MNDLCDPSSNITFAWHSVPFVDCTSATAVFSKTLDDLDEVGCRLTTLESDGDVDTLVFCWCTGTFTVFYCCVHMLVW